MPVSKKPTPSPTARRKPSRRWEYTTVSGEQPIRVAVLDDYGVQGWELVSVYVRIDAVHAVFKREVV